MSGTRDLLFQSVCLCVIQKSSIERVDGEVESVGFFPVETFRLGLVVKESRET